MSFDMIAKLEGPDLDSFLDLAAWMVEHREAVYRVRAVVDGGTLKLKVGERTWTPPMGRLDPECETARSEAARLEGPTDWVQRLRQDSPEIRGLFPVDPPA